MIPFLRSKVLRHLPAPPLRSTTPSNPEHILMPITSSPPNSNALRKSNLVFNSKVTSGEPLDTPLRRYAKGLTNTTERLAVQVAILRKETKEQAAILGSRKKRKTGKRAAIKGHFLLSTTEILDKVGAAELETAQRKAPKAPTRKRKRPVTPPEDEDDSEENSDKEEESDFSDCIVVGRR